MRFGIIEKRKSTSDPQTYNYRSLKDSIILNETNIMFYPPSDGNHLLEEKTTKNYPFTHD